MLTAWSKRNQQGVRRFPETRDIQDDRRQRGNFPSFILFNQDAFRETPTHPSLKDDDCLSAGGWGAPLISNETIVLRVV